MEDSELKRYIEYFQRQMLNDGAEEYWRGQDEWFENNRVEISEKFRSVSSAENDTSDLLAKEVLAHQKNGEFDNLFARKIFEPLLNQALDICENGGFALSNPVKLSNSPGTDTSPTALPSTDNHLLFVGQGTFAFCNYWSKIFSTAIAEIAGLSKKERLSPEAIILKLREGRVLVDAVRLAVHHACRGSVLGFGKLAQPEELIATRIMLVNAMEIFVIGHEIGHFHGHETYPESCGLAQGMTLKEHELECDKFGLAISTQYGVQQNNPFAFQLIGALLFFYALRTCEQTRLILSGAPLNRSDSHPTHEERFRHVLDFLKNVGADEQTMESVHFALDIGFCIGTEVQLTAQALKSSLSSV